MRVAKRERVVRDYESFPTWRMGATRMAFLGGAFGREDTRRRWLGTPEVVVCGWRRAKGRDVLARGGAREKREGECRGRMQHAPSHLIALFCACPFFTKKKKMV